MKTLPELWAELIETAQAKDWNTPDKSHDADFEYLDKIGAASNLIAAAKVLPGISCGLNIHWAPDAEMREYSPDHMFKNSMVIGSDGSGNSLIVLDVRDPESRIIFLDFDFFEILVVADSPEQLIEGLIDGYQNLNFQTEEQTAWGNYCEAMFNSATPKNPKFDFDLKARLESAGEELRLNPIVIDFNKAKAGDVLDFSALGKYDEIDNGDATGMIKITRMSPEAIKKNKIRDWLWYAAIAALFVGMTAYFHLTCDATCPECNPQCGKTCGNIFKSAGLGLLYSFGVLMVFIWIYGWATDYIYNQRCKREEKSKLSNA